MTTSAIDAANRRLQYYPNLEISRLCGRAGQSDDMAGFIGQLQEPATRSRISAPWLNPLQRVQRFFSTVSSGWDPDL